MIKVISHYNEVKVELNGCLIVNQNDEIRQTNFTDYFTVKGEPNSEGITSKKIEDVIRSKYLNKLGNNMLVERYENIQENKIRIYVAFWRQ